MEIWRGEQLGTSGDTTLCCAAGVPGKAYGLGTRPLSYTSAIFVGKSSQDNSNPIFAMEYVTAFRIIHSRSARLSHDRDRMKQCLRSCDFYLARPRKDAKCRDIFHREDGI